MKVMSLIIDTSNRECEIEVKADFVYSGKHSEPSLTYFCSTLPS